MHFKGGKYIFKCIALPLTESHIIEVDKSTSYAEATLESTMEKVRLFDLMGFTFTDHCQPVVIYQNVRYFHQLDYWARPVDDFFGHKELENGELVKRFTYMKEEW